MLYTYYICRDLQFSLYLNIQYTNNIIIIVIIFAIIIIIIIRIYWI